MLTVTRYKVVNDEVRGAAVRALRAALTSPGELDVGEASLLTLASSCGLINRVVDRPMRAVARRRLRRITQESGALNEALAEQTYLAYAVAGEVYGAVCSGSHGGGGHGGGHGGH